MLGLTFSTYGYETVQQHNTMRNLYVQIQMGMSISVTWIKFPTSKNLLMVLLQNSSNSYWKYLNSYFIEKPVAES